MLTHTKLEYTESINSMQVNVSNGKYTFVASIGSIEILRHGEAWHAQLAAFNAIASIMAELDAARVVIAACRRLGDKAPQEIQEALEKHQSLVDDHQLPSEWTSP